MKNFKKILALLLAVVMTVGTVAMIGAASITFNDTDGHWAWTNGAIPYLVDKNVLNGYKNSDGSYSFIPDGEVTRAEFIKMLDETFGLTATKAINFSDVKSTDWFCVYFQKAAAQGYLLNYGTSCNPNGKLTREEAISLLVRYLALDPEKKADASTFTDFNTVSSKYQDYVLEAIYAGLIDGYPDNTFRPNGTLTRAEALTILYRAAGCIYNAGTNSASSSYTPSVSSRDAGAPDGNTVVTKGGITIVGQTLTGRTIISEGASAGVVTFSNCTIKGDLYIRGNAKVILDKCKVDNIIDNGTGGVSLLTTSSVTNLTLNKKATVFTEEGTKISSLTVNSTAASSAVTGSADITKITVKAQGFKSDVIPFEYEIVNGLTAKFAGIEYSDSESGDSVFKVAPYTTADKNYYYIEFTALKKGTAYYYYTSSSKAPTTQDFDKNYASATYSGRISAEAGKEVSKKTFTISELKNYRYVVIMFQSGTTKQDPIVVSNSDDSATGFSTEPALTSAGDAINFKVSANGTVYYFYTESAEELTQAEFLKEYADCESALKGTVTATTKSAASFKINDVYSSMYDYVAVMLKSSSGAQYRPVIVPIGDNGFSVEPYVKTAGKIECKSSFSGTVYYYYSKTSTVPSTLDYLKEWNATTYRSRQDVVKNVTSTIEYRTSYSSTYPYMIIALRDAAGNFKLPVCVELGYESGFAVVPKMVSDTVVEYVVNVVGTVQYYFTSSSAVPTVEQFTYTYTNSVPAAYKGTEAARFSGFEGYITMPSGVTSSDYIAIMLTDSSGIAYAPIVISLKYDPNDSLTGFAYVPFVRDGELYIKTVGTTTVRYYYGTDMRNVTPADFYTNYNNAEFSGEISVTAGELKKLTINQSARLLYQTIVVAVWNGSRYGEPVCVYAFENSNPQAGITGFANSKSVDFVDTILIDPYYTGTLYYFATDSLSEATATFNKARADISSRAVTAGVRTAITESTKRYLVIALEANDTLYEKVVVDMTTGTTHQEKQYNDGANTTGDNIYTYANDAINHTVKFSTSSDCYVYYTLVGDGEIISYVGDTSFGNAGNVVATARTPLDFDYSTLYTYAQGLSNSRVMIYLQCCKNGQKYQSRVIILK